MPYCNATVEHTCFLNYSEIEKEEYCQSAIRAVHLYLGYIPLPFSIVECVITIFFLAAVCSTIQKHQVSRKAYLLIANRALGDLLISATMVIYASYMIVHEVVDNSHMEDARYLVFQGSFWLANTSYVALCCLKLFAVMRPFAYIKMVTFKTIVYVVLFSWLIFFAIVASKSALVALFYIPALRKWSGCTEGGCLGQFDNGHYIAAIVIYFITVACFATTVFFVRRARKNSKRIVADSSTKSTVSIDANLNAGRNAPTSRMSSASTAVAVSQKASSKLPRLRFSMWKLTLSVGSFVIFNAVYVIYASHMLTMPSDQNGDCELQLMENFIPRMFIPFTVTQCFLTLRIIIDPIISFIIDKAIRRSMLAMIGCKREDGDVTSDKAR